MSRQFVVFGSIAPTFFNETTSSQFVVPVLFLNATSATTGPNLLPIMGVGAKEPNAVDLLISAGLFAGLVVKENPVVKRRKLFTLGTNDG